MEKYPSVVCADLTDLQETDSQVTGGVFLHQRWPSSNTAVGFTTVSEAHREGGTADHALRIKGRKIPFSVSFVPLGLFLSETTESTEEEWQSIADLAAACRSILEALSREDRKAADQSGSDQTDGKLRDSKDSLYTMSLYTMSLYTMSLYTMSLYTMSLYTMSLYTMSLYTMSLYTMSLYTMSLYTMSLYTMSLYTMSLYTMSLYTISLYT
ncbi:unnamed protein product [Lota lota]